ncbi:hypothetical protein [Streptomyces sp. NBRC 110028]|uniref:hypothetical protein n=1 Tax=Streptomyces sp. NBRC 110028 TaxID=1621260 RepID=UPI0006E461D1|nr:hypothetical protein [Streptomyces sp. NBRC 110028]
MEPHDTWKAQSALAKILDYAGSGARHWPIHILQRSLEYTAQLQGSTGEQLPAEMGYSIDEGFFLRTIESNLAVGRLRMAIAASRFPPEFNRGFYFSVSSRAPPRCTASNRAASPTGPMRRSSRRCT